MKRSPGKGKDNEIQTFDSMGRRRKERVFLQDKRRGRNDPGRVQNSFRKADIVHVY